MKNVSLLSLIILLCFSCASPKNLYSKKTPLLDDNTFQLSNISDDKSYGYTEKNPINVGGIKSNEGPKNQRRFLNALLSSNGEKISYIRRGSCCPFKTPNGLMDNTGMLDIYEVTYEGRDEPIILYINLYDAGELKAPLGFTYRQ